MICAQEIRQTGWRKRRKIQKRETQDPRGWGERRLILSKVRDETRKKILSKSRKQPVSSPEKTGYRAVKEKASGLLCVHQLITEPDGQKHMLRVPFQSFINSLPCPSLWVYYLTLTLTHSAMQDLSQHVAYCCTITPCSTESSMEGPIAGHVAPCVCCSGIKAVSVSLFSRM